MAGAGLPPGEDGALSEEDELGEELKDLLPTLSDLRPANPKPKQGQPQKNTSSLFHFHFWLGSGMLPRESASHSPIHPLALPPTLKTQG